MNVVIDLMNYCGTLLFLQKFLTFTLDSELVDKAFVLYFSVSHIVWHVDLLNLIPLEPGFSLFKNIYIFNVYLSVSLFNN